MNHYINSDFYLYLFAVRPLFLLTIDLKGWYFTTVFLNPLSTLRENSYEVYSNETGENFGKL